MIRHDAHRMEGRRVYRFVLAERIAHWLNACTLFILVATGTVMLLRYPLGLSLRAIRHLHNLHLAIGLFYFIGPAAVLIIVNPRVGRRWVIEAIRWSRHDLLWLLGPLRRLFLPRGAGLKVGRFNAGQRMNMIFQLGGKWGLLLTGLVMHFSHGVISIYALHLALSFFLLFVAAGHIYMATLNPSTRPSLSAMLTGYVDADWLKHHHLGWFEELVSKHRETKINELPSPEPGAKQKTEEPAERGAGAPPEGPA